MIGDSGFYNKLSISETFQIINHVGVPQRINDDSIDLEPRSEKRIGITMFCVSVTWSKYCEIIVCYSLFVYVCR